MTTTDSPAEAAFRDYAATGDVTGFYALADYIQERTRGKKWPKLLLDAAKRNDPDVLFFYRHAAYHYGSEGPELGRLCCAIALADAEDWFEARDVDRDENGNGTVEVVWEEDPEYDPSDYDGDMPNIGWSCFVNVFDKSRYPNEWSCAASLHAITFERDYPYLNDPYTRVVRAELCLETMRSKRDR